ncbi:MAG: ABC transporter ATP-binding protein [Clostridiales bacterium]|nr:ABC transporter ATP-binding protein [Clostridiales bacterium]
MSEQILNVKGLETVYKTDKETVRAVNSISFTLDKGETLGIVGETGSGKTTTALSILRLLPSISGRILNGSIEFDGEDLLKLPEKQMRKVRGKRISMIFQDPMTSLNPLDTVEEQLREALSVHAESSGLSKADIEARIDEVLTLVGIVPERKSEYPHQFSGGMKQRVVIAMALACNPELIIADEPTTALDVTIQAQVLAMINELKDKLNTAMIMITHDLGIVAETCDKVAIMYAGEFIESGTVEEIIESEYHHPYTIGLFGSIPSLTGNETRLSPILGLMPDPTDLPQGCFFSPRCKHCTERCKTEHPPEYWNGTHKIQCFLFEGKENWEKKGE